MPSNAAASSNSITDGGAPNTRSPFVNTAGRYLNKNWKIASSECAMVTRDVPTSCLSRWSLDYDAHAVLVETRTRRARFPSPSPLSPLHVRYFTVDVFTDQMFGGNQLAV